MAFNPDTDNRNIYEFSVSELAMSLKRTVEDTFGHVRVRGELGRVTIAKSGHVYLDIKDDKAVINAIIWKGAFARLSMRPEEGMEVVVEGRMSTYPGRSNYQLIIEKMDLAGAGALMALFERRKATFQKEGLFDRDSKQELPFMPKVIGVVTSPTGAVIRDILHRIMDRFPVHVIVWPVLVQGEKAAEQISEAITGFNHATDFPKPDVLIVARGGGSLEDLWCFNEEIVVRAAARSSIPLISAVGHETDWTLIDYVADYRAPTPTGAAEIAVPVREEYLDTVADYALRLSRAQRRGMEQKRQVLKGMRLPRLEAIMSVHRQRLDLASLGLNNMTRRIDTLSQRLVLASMGLGNINRSFDIMAQRLAILGARLPTLARLLDPLKFQFSNISARLRPEVLERPQNRNFERLTRASKALTDAYDRRLDYNINRLSQSASLLEAFSYQGVLSRGYVLVTDAAGQLVRSRSDVSVDQAVTLTFADGARGAKILASDGGVNDTVTNTSTVVTEKTKPKSKQNRKSATSKPKASDASQPDLF